MKLNFRQRQKEQGAEVWRPSDEESEAAGTRELQPESVHPSSPLSA
ncbi:hypothetical protein ALC56_00398 [Trachymyrmex septentrionalis]|uniref:Uncharacterized protein n=1 Tax=Trachymyrmex septentrionalis TaxID=34720 RepID=A0A195FXI6_9HYME|nr:hypothetical protein ALC56_00398 [Trachymyrmex septentrionalis]